MNEPTAQLEHEVSVSGENCSQCARILSVLREAGEGAWVPMPELARAASNGGQGTGICVSRRIYDLRKRLVKDQQTIKQRDEFKDGVRFSFYALTPIEPVLSTLSSNPSQL